ncbi:7145_t:CDS:2 [Scutellospora calospora]|uniref:7145_t:CDS:1 n=1 Tax=Scutellospora calospora TaxID=85575 RepID=A0ACA9L767_9GLOM|nr:7145_t:CDS:2 [Scutellospora calospora]
MDITMFITALDDKSSTENCAAQVMFLIKANNNAKWCLYHENVEK